MNKKLLVVCLLLLFTTPLWAATRTVINCADSGAGSLRQAVLDAVSGDEIIFDITTTEAGYSTGEAGPGLVTNEADSNTWYRIILNSEITISSKNNIYINGFSQTQEATNEAGPEIEIRCSPEAETYFRGINLDAANYCTIEGLVLNGFDTLGSQSIYLDNSNYNQILGCYFGTSASGEAIYPNYNSIDIYGSYNKIGNATDDGKNIISGSTNKAVNIQGTNANSNEVLGNYIGTDINGTTDLGNNAGVYITNGSKFNKIGNGTIVGKNIISGNNYGIRIYDSNTTNNEILGNYIGTDVTGSANLENTYGVRITSGSLNKIGNGTTGGRNIISGNSYGVYIGNAGASNEVLGNYIGVDVTGISALANSTGGVYISSNAQFNRIGSSESIDQRNIVAGHSGGNDYGIQINNASNNIIEGNWIGLGTDESVIANEDGIEITNGSQNNYIIANVVSGNTAYGVHLTDTDTNSNEVLGNFIGTDSTGTAALGNGFEGILIGNASSYNKVGDATAGSKNIISGNSGNGGIRIIGLTSNYNEILGNFIGTDVAGTTALANVRGVYLDTTLYNKIGNGTTGGRNIISGNSNDGIFISEANSNEVLGNYIGTDVSGTTGIINLNGVAIFSGAKYNKIGNGTADGRNIIASDNSGTGIGLGISGAGTNSNEVLGNYIGTDVNGTADLGFSRGIFIQNQAQHNKIGDGTAGAGNLISGNNNMGIQLLNAGAETIGTSYNEILGNLIGTQSNGTTPLPNNAGGILIYSTATNARPEYNLIGSTQASGRNIIAGNTNGYGIRLAAVTNNQIEGNWIGLGTDESASANEDGIVFNGDASFNYVSSNIISGNTDYGIRLGDLGTQNNSNEVYSNYIGVKPDGIAPLPNGAGGIYIEDSHCNRIGSSETSKRNILSGHSGAGDQGIDLNTASTNNIIEGNWIGLGTDESIVGNNTGIQIRTAAANNHIIANIISGNTQNGIRITGTNTNSNEVIGNIIGLNSAGTTAIANQNNGIYILSSASYNKIGNGTDAGRNIISKNGNYGVYISSSNTNEVIGNYIGTDVSGIADLGNAYSGVYLDSSQYNKIGGTSAGERNIISGNNDFGIYFNSSNTNEVIGNYIGLDVFGTANLGNTYGVWLNSSKYNKIGPSNNIAHNGNATYPAGIRLEGASTVGNVITRNSIFENYVKGISFVAAAHPTTSTPEVITADLNEVTGFAQITGESSLALANGTIEIFKAQGNQGKIYLGSAEADASGNWDTTLHVGSLLVSGDAVTATGTTQNPETSEFSPTKEVFATVVKEYQPDGLVGTLESGADYIGEGITATSHETTTQIIETTKSSNETFVFYVKIINSGNASDEIRVNIGSSTSEGWDGKVYDSKTGPNEITAQAGSSGWFTPTLASGASTEIRFEGRTTLNEITTLEAWMTLTSSGDAIQKDVLKGILTAIPLPPTDLTSFDVSLPATTIQNSPFSATITARDSTGAVEELVIGETLLSVDSGTIEPTSIADTSFSAGVWTEDVTLNTIGPRTITVSNEGAIGTATILVTNATIELDATDLGITGMSITIPAGASSSEVSLAAAEVTTSPGAPAPGYQIGGTIINITGTPTTFMLPVTVTIPITGPLVAPTVRYWNGTEWSTDGITLVSYTDTSLTFTTTHFTMFAIMSPLASNLVRFGPNPYNPGSGTPAKIWYYLPADAGTSIYIVSTNGTLIWKNSYGAGLNGGRAGENIIDFNGKDRWGNVLGDGVYIYKIVQGGKSIGGGKIAIIK